jgi:2-methylcitrate dehydratase PrpD
MKDVLEELVDGLWTRYGLLELEDVPSEVRTVALHCVTDWYGCALAGSAEPGPQILLAELGEISGPAWLVGSNRRTGVLQAALINGTAGHALDFDDTSTVMNGHPTAPVMPAALALAEELGSSGSSLIAAYVAGAEVEAQLGVAMGGSHYARGWHATSTIGVFGAAAAASRLLRLDRERFGHALGLAASQSSGVKANFGTMTKPFHAGHAAQCGLLSARLAARGFTSDLAALGSRQGLAQAAGSGSLHLDRLSAYTNRWAVSETLFKYHAACYLTHAAIDATLELRDELEDDPIESVTVTVHPSLLNVCAISQPTTGLEAKFSLSANIAFALLGSDTTNTETYSDTAVTDPDLNRLARLVSIETDDDMAVTSTNVSVTTRRGLHECLQDSGTPAVDLDLQGARLSAKFLGLASPRLGPKAASGTLERLRRLDTFQDVRELTNAR